MKKTVFFKKSPSQPAARLIFKLQRCFRDGGGGGDERARYKNIPAAWVGKSYETEVVRTSFLCPRPRVFLPPVVRTEIMCDVFH